MTVWGAHPLISPVRLATLDRTAVDVVAISADGLVAVTAAGTRATVWSVGIAVSPRSESTFTTAAPITAAAFTANGETLVVGDATGHVTTIGLADPTRPSMGPTLSGHTGKITQVAIAGSDNASVATVDEYGGISAWTLGSSQRTATAASFAVRPAGRGATVAPVRGGLVLVATPEEPAAVWLWTSPEPNKWFTLPFQHPQPVAALLTGDGSRAVTVGAHGHVTIWSFDSVVAAMANPGPRACALIGEPPTEQQWHAAVGAGIPYRAVC